MHVFQILNKEVTVIDGNETYIDSYDNFLVDGGPSDLPKSIIYDETQKCCVVDGEFLPYPNEGYENIIASIQSLINAQGLRHPQPKPTDISPKTALTADYNEQARELSKTFTIACLRGDSAAQESIKQDFSALQEAYKEEMEALNHEI